MHQILYLIEEMKVYIYDLLNIIKIYLFYCNFSKAIFLQLRLLVKYEIAIGKKHVYRFFSRYKQLSPNLNCFNF